MFAILHSLSPAPKPPPAFATGKGTETKTDSVSEAEAWPKDVGRGKKGARTYRPHCISSEEASNSKERRGFPGKRGKGAGVRSQRVYFKTNRQQFH